MEIDENMLVLLLHQAIGHPHDQEMRDLLNRLRTLGMSNLRSSSLRLICAHLCETQQAALLPGIEWLLRRIRDAGLPPSLPSYTGSLETVLFHDIASCSHTQVGRYTARCLYDLLDHLISLPQFESYPQQERLKKYVQDWLKKCQPLITSQNPIKPLPAYVLDIYLLPESNIANELIFLRVVQCIELIFFSASVLIERAIALIRYADSVEALVALHWAVSLTGLLTPLLRPLACMNRDEWLEMRPYIAATSALQSTAFQKMVVEIHQLQRLFNHPRMADDQQCYIEICSRHADTILTSVQAWYNAHKGVARKYEGFQESGVFDAVKWLDMQNPLLNKDCIEDIGGKV